MAIKQVMLNLPSNNSFTKHGGEGNNQRNITSFKRRTRSSNYSKGRGAGGKQERLNYIYSSPECRSRYSLTAARISFDTGLKLRSADSDNLSHNSCGIRRVNFLTLSVIWTPPNSNR